MKVDRSFIREIERSEEDSALTGAIIAMGKILSLTTIAEGVETEARVDFLRERACDEILGFCFSKPLPAEDFASLMSENQRVAVG